MSNNSDSELAAVLAHEVKNPVSIIKINLEYIRSYLPKEIKKNIDVIDNALARLDRIIEDYRLMNIDKSDNELIYVEDMLRDIIEDYNITADNIEFRYNCTSELSLYGNYDKLSILFYNIYKNAVEAIDGEGIIETTAEYRGDNVVIKIRDNGEGFKDIKSVGSPYYTTKENGTGLGILICKNIVRQHGGEMYFENNNWGSEVSVILPTNQEESF